MPRLSRSADVRLPEYVGRMSLPISSITASSCAYLLWCCCDAAALDRAAKLVGIVNCGGGVLRTTTSAACAAAICGFGGGVPRMTSAEDESICTDRGVPGLLEATGVPGSELLE